MRKIRHLLRRPGYKSHEKLRMRKINMGFGCVYMVIQCNNSIEFDTQASLLFCPVMLILLIHKRRISFSFQNYFLLIRR